MTSDNKDAMEYIWEKIPKTKEDCIHYLPGDIPYLYKNGFVDTLKYSYQQWKAAFEDVIQDDGSYLVNRDKFMSLRPYRYDGSVFRPFDANQVREGEWNDNDLQKLYDRSIKPSSDITQDIYWNSIKALKKQKELVSQNGNLIVNQKVKTQLAYLIDRFPSPRRRLEKEVDRIRSEREENYREIQNKRDASQFTSGRLASEDKMEKLSNLQSSSNKKKSETPSFENKSETINIKNLRKPTGKIRG